MVNNKATLHIIQGFICAGKTTFAKKLSTEINAKFFNIDDVIIKEYSPDYYLKNWERCFNDVLNDVWKEIEICLNKGEDVVFDMGFWLKSDRDFARLVAKKCGAEIKLYYLFVPDDILKERIINSRPKEWANLHIKNFEINKSKFQEPKSDENAIIINNY